LKQIKLGNKSSSENWKPVRTNVYKCSCCPIWGQGSLLLAETQNTPLFLLEDFTTTVLLLVDSLCLEILLESCCGEHHFLLPFSKTHTQPNLSLYHSSPSHFLERGSKKESLCMKL